MKKRILFILMMFYNFIRGTVALERYTINSLQDIIPLIDSKTLFVIDIDDTLIYDMARGAMTLIEPTVTPSLFTSLKKKSWGVIAITARNTEPSYRYFTLEQMKHHGFEFSQFFKNNDYNKSCILLNDINYAFYTNGIIFVQGTDKGKALEAFLSHLTELPETIVVVDDKRYNIDAIFNTFKSNNFFKNLKIILCDYPHVENNS